MRKIGTLFLLPFWCLLAVSCGSEPVESPEVVGALERYQYAEAHIGTTVRLVFYLDDEDQADALAAQCYAKLKVLELVLSDYKAESEVRKLCALPIGEAHPVSGALFDVLERAQEIAEKSGGAFDVTMGTQSQAWRAREELEPSAVSYKDLVLDKQQRSVTLLKPMVIDLGGIGKGYMADALMEVLRGAGVKCAAVVIGGETVLGDAPPEKKGWHIGIEDPEHKIVGKVVLENTALSTSGDSYQFFEADGQRRSHLIDPSSKQSMSNRLNVMTLAKRAIDADGWATALRVMPIKKAIKIANAEPDLEALFIPYQKDTIATDRFPTH
ncbi:FAD:protein FMN transferase [Rubritalea tangerina]|uniref:FAD:protein FMN transferase n=1 Tax=Rubritalea tangerina TaxID=430798 RepID=A0ABW4ZD73_9BACT